MSLTPEHQKTQNEIKRRVRAYLDARTETAQELSLAMGYHPQHLSQLADQNRVVGMMALSSVVHLMKIPRHLWLRAAKEHEERGVERGMKVQKKSTVIVTWRETVAAFRRNNKPLINQSWGCQ